jgi:hypothetical protein
MHAVVQNLGDAQRADSKELQIMVKNLEGLIRDQQISLLREQLSDAKQDIGVRDKTIDKSGDRSWALRIAIMSAILSPLMAGLISLIVALALK